MKTECNRCCSDACNERVDIVLGQLDCTTAIGICILASCGGTISTHSLFSVTTTRKENSVFSTTCFDLLKSLSSAVCHTINMSLIVYNCGKPLLCYHVLLLAVDNKNR
jgi:hypothetical protein